MPLKISESDIERTCTELLQWDGWRSLKTDPVSRKEWGKGFGELGMADHLYIRYSIDSIELGTWTPAYQARGVELMWIEFKSLRGTAAKHQKLWHLHERGRGALTLIAGEDFPASIEGFREWYENSGLRRKPLAKLSKSG